MGNRDILLQEIDDAVTAAERDGTTIDVNQLAIVLSSRNPQSGLTIESICDLITGVLAATQDGTGGSAIAAELNARRQRGRVA